MPKKLRKYRTFSSPRPCTTMATTSSRWATCAAGWRSRLKTSVSKSIRALPPRKRCSMKTAWYAASSPATWVSTAKAIRRKACTPPAWNCAPSTRCSPKAAVVTSASSCSSASSSTTKPTCSITLSASRKSGKSTRQNMNRGWWFTPQAGRWTMTIRAARSFTTWKTIRSWSA